MVRSVRLNEGLCSWEHGQLRRKQQSDYGVQLREKQKMKRMYGLLEKQFRGYFKKADQKKGITGTNLFYSERRLDNMIYRLGFANSRNEARQLIRHNHFSVNGKKVNIPSYLVNVGDVIEITEASRGNNKIVEAMETVARRGIPQWLELEQENFKGKVKMFPTRDELTMPIQEQLVVELYSK